MDGHNNVSKCIECGRTVETTAIRFIDDKPVCLECLYGKVNPITIWPIGEVVNDRKRNSSGFGTTGSDLSEIHLYSGQERFTTGLAEESHLIIIWHLHQRGPTKTVFNRGWDGKCVGPFASRTPDRLTPIASTEVELIKVEGTKLIVRGLDAINGTSVLDIKVAMTSLRRR